MSIEQKINYQLNKFPAIKKVIKRVYQVGMYTISPKIKSEGNIIRISPDDKNHEYFFGYYDKSPWDATDRYMLCMKAKDTWSDVSPKEKADILIIDTEKAENDKTRVKKISETSAWNVQQSCMLQWLGPDFRSKILYNDYRNGKYVSVILTLSNMEERVIDAPVYSVSSDGKMALTLDFSRLYNLRPGYGYYNTEEKTKGVSLPDSTAIWKINLETGSVESLLKYTDFANFEPRKEMKEEGSVHKVNHIMLSPNGKRFMVLYRWFNGQRKYTRLVTCNVDGSEMYVLSDDDMVSHCFWKNDEEILAFENKHKTGPGYYLMKDKTKQYIHCWPQFSNDGHPSYSPDKKLIVTDSYPDRARIASINLMDGDETKKQNTTVARVFAPFKYDNDTRCDLHPRWNHAGNEICFDSVYEGHRGLYVVDGLMDQKKDNVKVLFLTDTMRQRFGVTSVILNLLSHWSDSSVSIDVIAYPDSEKEVISKLKELGVTIHYMPKLSVKNLTGFAKFYKQFFEKNTYDIVHSHFNQIDAIVFPIARSRGVKKCVSHSHNTRLSDYKIKAIRNRMMCFNIAHNADCMAACSEVAGLALYGKSFSNSKKKLIIHNGVDCSKYEYKETNRVFARNEFGVDNETIVIGHVGSFKPQKNQIYLVRVFEELLKINSKKKYKLVFVGNGQTIEETKQECSKLKIEKDVIFTGARSDVEKLMCGFDLFVMPSLYEGLPVTAIEAQANGLSCLLSDSITSEVDLTGVSFMSLNDGEKAWAKSILKLSTMRSMDNYDKLKKMGYDINKETRRLATIYKKMVE